MAIKDWKKSDWGFSNSEMWNSFRKGSKTIMVKKQSKGWVVSIDGEKVIKPFKTSSGAYTRAKKYMSQN